MPHIQKFSTLADCERIAELAHFNQFDKAGYPYINHPRRVMESVQTQGAPPYVQMAAILHDVTEDTAFTCQMLLDLGVPAAAVEIVRLVDRDASAQAYAEQTETVRKSGGLWWTGTKYVEPNLIPGADEFYYLAIRRNPGALMVKLADISDNTLPWRVSYLPATQQEKGRVKYTKALEILTS